MNGTYIRSTALCLLLTSSSFATAIAADKPFDSKRDPQRDLEAAEAQAKVEHKNILLDVGGNWCSWCLVLDGQLHHEPNQSLLGKGFVVVHVSHGIFFGTNDKFLRQFPKVRSYPHLFILAPDGHVLKEVDASEISPDDKHAKSYDEVKIHDLLVKWTPVSAA